MNRSEDILKETNCLSVQQMQDYIKERLTPEEVRRVEMHLASCEFCSEALEGLTEMKDPEEVSMILKQVKRHFNSRIQASHHQRKKQKNYIWLVVVIFIIILFLLLAFYGIDFSLKKDKKSPSVAPQEQIHSSVGDNN